MQRAEAVDQSTLVEHVFSPTATQPCTPDPAVPCIDPTLADHHAWFNPAATNNQLLVYLPGTGDVPANALLFQQLGADLGYHVIGLMYEDGNFIAGLCRNEPDPDACFFNARYEVVYGVNTSTKLQVSPTKGATSSSRCTRPRG